MSHCEVQGWPNRQLRKSRYRCSMQPKKAIPRASLEEWHRTGKLVIVLSIFPSTERRSSAHLVVRTTNGSHQVPRLVSPCTWKTGAFVTNAVGRFILTSY